uniref:Evasin n=1 Tax=Rhipicephalus zambeziensis TaxID=60191 RepID=A0A224Y5T4_9ACAR
MQRSWLLRKIEMVLFRLNISYIVVSVLLFQQAYLERSADCSIQLNTPGGKRNVGCYWTCDNVATTTRDGEECIGTPEKLAYVV